MTSKIIRQIVLLWLAWSVILIGYMQIAPMRYAPERPDEALIWTAGETQADSLLDKPYLIHPMLNTQVAWDSEFYLSVATVGYDDPDIRLVENDGESYAMSYAFFPLYPYIMRVVRLPFVWAGMEPISASTIAGVIVSLLGTLAGMLALADIVTQDDEQKDSQQVIRTVFTMLIFPTSVYFATVYTEGLFVGLAFTSLALMRRKQWIAAAILAAFATWTRAIGGVLLAPLLLSWVLAYYQAEDKKALLLRLPVLFLPVVAYGLWRYFFGTEFDFVQANWFGNQLFQMELTQQAWSILLERAESFSEARFIVVMGVTSIAFALVSCLLLARRYPMLALFGFLALVIPLTGGWTGTQSSARYVLAVPTMWILLGEWSKNPIFERAWTLLSVLLLAMTAFLFSFDFWVA